MSAWPFIAVLAGAVVWPILMLLGIMPRWARSASGRISPTVLTAIFWIIEVGIGGVGLKLAQGKGPLLAILIFSVWSAGLCFPLWIVRRRMATDLAKLLSDEKSA